MRRPAVLTAACLGLLAGCGYAVGWAPVRPDVRTIAVEVVDNASFRQRFERDLTASIARQLSEYSGYRHASRSNADAVLEVRIVDVRNSPVVYGIERPVYEGSLDAVATIRLIERRSGAVLVDTRHRDIAEYRTLIGEGEASARAELVSDLGRRIVLALERDF